MISRRAVLLGATAAGAAGFAPSALGHMAVSRDTLPPNAPVRHLALSAAEMEVALLGPDKPKTQGFCAYNGTPFLTCLLYTSPSPRDLSTSRMPSSA